MTRFSQKMKAALLLGAFVCIASNVATAQTAPLLEFDFNGKNPWPQAAADVMPSTPIDLLTTFEVQAVGTPDAAKNAPSGAMLLGAEVGDVQLNWSAIYTSGLFAIQNSEADLTRLKLGLNLSASAAHPVRLQIESFDAKKRRTGGVETLLEPKNADAFERFDLDLSSFKATGDGKFSPCDPFVQFTFVLSAPAWTNNAFHQIRIDDLSYGASPAHQSAPAK